ncbi:MAG: ABC transporter ATP-binding protein [Lachnospiraceae bacterium]|nr:ABC transporter ATP-binding protein [Lachnospiraceae bacterium]
MIVKADEITKQFLRKRENSNVFYAVEKTTAEFRGGNLIMIYGQSGSGKSTWMNMLGGILQPSSGRVLYDRTELYAMDDDTLSKFRNQHIGMIPQGQTAIHSMNVRENILLPFSLYGKEISAETGERADRMLEEMGIADLSAVMPSELSGGELRRMAIARALIRQPEVIFADEPTGDLDDENTRTVLSILRRQADMGKLVMVVTHDREVAEFADLTYRMSGGRLCLEEPEQIV